MKDRNATLDERVRSARAYVRALARRFSGCGAPHEELVAAGNLGLVEAALRFDPSRGVKFVTYADWWIRKAMLHAIQDQAAVVRVPRGQRERLRRAHETRPERAPATRAALSLDQPASREGDRTLGDNLPSLDPDSDPERLVRADYFRHLHRRLIDLSPRERKVLALRFGFFDDEPMTLREVAREIGLSRERVRQIERRALERLKHLLVS